MIPLLTTLSTVLCPHGGRATLATSNTVAQVDGGFVLLQSDEHAVVGCPFTIPPSKPQPCVKIRWVSAAVMTKVNQTPVLLQTSTGLCFSAEGIPQGPAVVAQTQSKARGQ